MRGGGGERVITALLSTQRLTGKAYIAVLPLLLKKQAEAEVKTAYITDALQIIAENTARIAGGNYPKDRYADIIKFKPRDTRTGDEIAADIIRKLVSD